MRIRRVLVINPPLLVGKDFIDYPFFTSLGALSNAAALREQGFSVVVADAQALESSTVRAAGDGAVSIGSDLNRLLDEVAGHFESVVVGISPYLMPHANAPFTRDVVATLRARFPSARLVAADFYFGGMHYVEYDGEELLRRYPEIDAVVKYAGEKELPALLKKPSSDYGSRVVAGRTADLDLDELPFPAWDLIRIDRYYAFLNDFFRKIGRPPPFGSDLPMLPVITSRGCAYRCSFCTSNPGETVPNYRAHGPAYLEKHFSTLKSQFGARRLVFLDGCPNYSPERFREILGIVERLGLKCEFPNGLRADKLMISDLRRLKELSESVSISAESADPEILARHIKKGMSVEAVERVAAWCRELSLPLRIHYIIGMPGEKLENINRTLDHALRMHEEFGAVPLLQNFVPIPGTSLHDDCVRDGLLEHFDADNLYRHFQGAPAIETPAFSRSQIARMAGLLRRRLESSSLEKIIINLTYHCNNRCRFCAIGDRDKRHGDLKRYCRHLRDYRLRGVTSVDLDGGEPTLYPHFTQLVRFARRCGYRTITVTTNGRRLSDGSFASRFLLSGITDLLISLHGHDARIHEYHTRRKGSFDEAIRGIMQAVRLKPRRVTLGVNTVVTAKNAPFLSQFFRLVRDLGVGKVNVQFVTPFGSAAQAAPDDWEGMSGYLAAAVAEWRDALQIEMVNTLPCQMKGLLEMRPELGKHSREMVFVDAPPQNLAAYLDVRRQKTDACRACEFSIGCSGFYVFGRQAR